MSKIIVTDLMRCYAVLSQRLMLILLVAMAGCSPIKYTISEDIAQSLSSGIANQSDVEMVKSGIPSYVILLDGMITENPDNPVLLLSGARLNNTYATFLSGDKQRSVILIEKAHRYGQQSLCRYDPDWCGIEAQPYEQFLKIIDEVDRDEINYLYVFGANWVYYIDAHSGDMNAIANLPKVKATMQKIIELDDKYDHGGAHLYLGVLETIVPPALGGKPGIAKTHFERVLQITSDRHLMAKVLLAERYARQIFNRELHDRLLKEVLASNPVEKGLTLSNIIAQQRARQLLESADEYF